MPLHPPRYRVFSWHSAEGWNIHKGVCCSAVAVLKPHLILAVLPCPSSLPALSSWHGALRGIDSELGTAKSTNTFLSLILYPVPSLQLKSQGAKQKTHTTHIQFFPLLSHLPPTPAYGPPRRWQGSYTSKDHMSAEKWSGAEKRLLSALLFSSLRQKSKTFWFKQWLQKYGAQGEVWDQFPPARISQAGFAVWDWSGQIHILTEDAELGHIHTHRCCKEWSLPDLADALPQIYHSEHSTLALLWKKKTQQTGCSFSYMKNLK